MSPTVRLVRDKDCKGVIRYALPEDATPEQVKKAPVTNVYISRLFLGGNIPDAVEVSVTIVREAVQV